ncbi:MAG: hypothetical protein WA110_03100 [Anaerolineaceae bacterium]
MKSITQIFKGFDWFFLASGIMTYTLGSVIASQAGQPWKLDRYVYGLVIFLGLYLLERIYYYLSTSKISLFSTVNRTEKLKSPELIGLLFLVFAGLVYSLFVLNQSKVLGQSGWLWLFVLVLLFSMNISRSIRLWNMPYRWLVDGLIVSPISLFFASSVQGLAPGRILFFLSIPLLLFYLTSSTCLQFERYSSELSKGTRSFLVTLGWEKGVVIHNIILLLAFIFFGVYLYVSGAWSIAWPVFLMLIISLAEVYLLQRLAEGMKPNWRLLRAVAVFQYLGVVYILLFAFLTH